MTARLAALCAALALAAAPLAAFEALEFASPDHERRYRALTHELRCLVCQNQSLADSNAELAGDLRVVVFEMIRDGSDDAEIVDFLLARYGDFVLYRPPLKGKTVLLWLGPFAALLAGAVTLALVARGFARARDAGDAGEGGGG